jgi:thiamine-phosphate diphosphorylase
VRLFAPERLIIGASVGSEDEVPHAAGADFVAIGPVFSSSIVAGRGESIGIERFAELAAECQLPAVAVGGVAPANAAALMAAGAAGVAVINALLGADDPMHAARVLRSALDASGT